MAATTIHRLTLNPMGKCSNVFSETTNMITSKLYILALIIFVVSEKKAFEHFPIGSNVKCILERVQVPNKTHKFCNICASKCSCGIFLPYR
jgi:hypothetical protein